MIGLSLDQKIYQYSPESNKVDQIPASEKNYTCIEYNPDGLSLTTSTLTGEISLIDISTQKPIYTSNTHSERVGVIQWMNNSVFVSGGKDS